MADMKISMVLQLIDKITAPTRKVSEGLNKLTGSTHKVADASEDASKDARRLSDNLERVGHSARRADRASSGLGNTVRALAGFFAGFSLAAVVGGFINTSAAFEGYQTTLETVLGSQEKARSAMAWVQEFAEQTPYEIGQVTEAFVKLTSYGIDPQARAMKSLGNASSAMGKELNMGIEALADAQSFQFERLREFGITTMQQGDKVTFAYVQNNKQVTKTVKKTAMEVQTALLDIFDARFEGAMMRQSKTWAGVMSNMKDKWTNFQKAVGDKGFFEHVKNKLAGFLDKLNSAEGKAQGDVWAQKLSDSLTRLFDSLFALAESIDWVAVVNGITSFVEAVTKLIENTGGLKMLVDIGIATFIASLILGFTNLVPVIIAVASALFGLNLAAAPIIAVIAVVAALAAAGYLLWRNWDTVKKWFSGFVDWISDNFMKLPLPLKWLALPFLLIKNWGKVTGFFKGLWTRISTIWKGMPWWMQAIVSLPATIVTHWDKIAPALAKIWDKVKDVFSKAVDGIWNILPDWMRGLLTGVGSVIQFIAGGENFLDRKVSHAAPVARMAPNIVLPKPQVAQSKSEVTLRLLSDKQTSIERLQSTPGAVFNVKHGGQFGQ